MSWLDLLGFLKAIFSSDIIDYNNYNKYSYSFKCGTIKKTNTPHEIDSQTFLDSLLIKAY